MNEKAGIERNEGTVMSESRNALHFSEPNAFCMTYLDSANEQPLQVFTNIIDYDYP